MRVKDEGKIGMIYEATLRLIQEVGIAGITVAKIAKEAKLATGTVYIYFTNKEDLINQLYLHLKKTTTEDLFVGYDAAEPVKICIKKLFVNALQNKMVNFKEGVFMEQYYHSPYISQETKQIGQTRMLPIIELLERGKAELLIKPIENELLLSLMAGFVRQLAHAHVLQKFEMTPERVEQSFQAIWDAMKA